MLLACLGLGFRLPDGAMNCLLFEVFVDSAAAVQVALDFQGGIEGDFFGADPPLAKCAG